MSDPYGKTWWGRKWWRALETIGLNYPDQRIVKGRALAGQGEVADLSIEPGVVSGRVADTAGVFVSSDRRSRLDTPAGRGLADRDVCMTGRSSRTPLAGGLIVRAAGVRAEPRPGSTKRRSGQLGSDRRFPQVRGLQVAEDRGFEPLRAVNPTRFPSERHRPLGESSAEERTRRPTGREIASPGVALGGARTLA